MALEKIHADYLPSVDSPKASMMFYIGAAGVVLSLINLFLNPLTNGYYLVSILASACAGFAGFMVFGALAKGTKESPIGESNMLKLASYLVLAMNACSIIVSLMVISGSGSLQSLGAIGLLVTVVGLVYYVVTIIAGVKIYNNYTGVFKTVGLMYFLIPAVAILMAIVGVGTVSASNAGSMAIIFGLISAGLNGYYYYVATTVIGGKKPM